MKKLHQRMALQLQGQSEIDDKEANCSADQRETKAKGNAVGYYRPITCLPIMWKVLTGIITEDVYQHLHQSSLNRL